MTEGVTPGLPETETPGLPPRPGAAGPRRRPTAPDAVAVQAKALAAKALAAKALAAKALADADGAPPPAFRVRFVPRPPAQATAHLTGHATAASDVRSTGDAAAQAAAQAAGGPADMEADEVPPPGTVALFEAAVRSHSRRLLAIARAIVNSGNRGGVSAEDVVQQALTNLYQHRDRYDWREPGGLMRRAVVNEALRVLRQPRTTPVADDYPDAAGGRGKGAAPGAGSFASRGHTTAHPWSPADPMIDQETVLRVRQAISRLPEHFRAALVLCEYEGMAYTQIAEVLGASVPQVKTWLHRGRRQLAEMLKDFVGAEPKQPKHRVKAENAGDVGSANPKAGGGATGDATAPPAPTRPPSGPAKRGTDAAREE